MPIRIDTRTADFATAFAAFLGQKREAADDVEQAARQIIGDVIARGDAALFETTKKFDRFDLNAGNLRVGAGEIDNAVKACDAKTLDALKFARDRIEVFHSR